MFPFFQKTSLIISAFLLSAFLYGCASTTSGGAIGAERSQMMLIGSQQLNAEAARQYDDMLDKARKEKVLNTDKKIVARVDAIVDRIIPQTAHFRADATSWDWEANVIKSDELNAFCMPGGKIIVLTGIVQKLALTDDELAAIIGHEIAHALREHSREQASQDVVVGVLAELAGILTKTPQVSTLGNQAGQLVLLKYSRDAEIEADRIGLELMARAGYNPDAAVTLWKKMQNATGNKESVDWFSTHPNSSDRINVLARDAAIVRPYYEAYQAKKQQEQKDSKERQKK